MRFDELVNILPKNQALPDIAGLNSKALVVTPEGVPGYVRPQFVVRDWPAGASVLLVEAPGAVGKSAAARSLAAALNWPLILAEHAQVGSYSLSGLIQDSLGFQSDYLSAVARGASGLVIDSLDEALFRAGTDNFLAFIDNVWKVATGVRDVALESRAPSVILFSRSDAAELIKLSFVDAGVPFAETQLDFFSKSDAEAFISSYLSQRYEEMRKPDYNIFRSNPAPFEKLRNGRLRQVAALLTRDEHVSLTASWNEVKDFLGYAPVLTAVAESLAVSNPASLRNVSFDARSQSDLIGKIVDSILRREQQKFRVNMETKLRSLTSITAEPADGAALYTPQEQCARLLSRVEKIPITQTAPVQLPSELRPVYEDAASQFIADHPFLRGGDSFGSLVFSDYVRARLLMDLDVVAELKRMPRVGEDDVGPFFARFLTEMCPDESPLEVGENVVEPVLASWLQERELAGGAGAAEPHLYYTLTGNHGTVVCDPDATTIPDMDSADLFVFGVTDLTGAYQLGERLRSLTFFTDQAVLLGNRGRQLEVGPKVAVIAKEVDIEAESIRAARNPEAPSVLLAETIAGNYLTRVEAETDSLVVMSPSLKVPLLQPFLDRVNTVDVGTRYANFSNFVDLRNVLMAFRPSRKGSRIHEDYMYLRVVRDAESRHAIVNDLLARGVVSRESPWLYLDLGSLSTLGFGLIDIKKGEPSGAIISYLKSVDQRASGS